MSSSGKKPLSSTKDTSQEEILKSLKRKSIEDKRETTKRSKRTEGNLFIYLNLVRNWLIVISSLISVLQVPSVKRAIGKSKAKHSGESRTDREKRHKELFQAVIDNSDMADEIKRHPT